MVNVPKPLPFINTWQVKPKYQVSGNQACIQIQEYKQPPPLTGSQSSLENLTTPVAHRYHVITSLSFCPTQLTLCSSTPLLVARTPIPSRSASNDLQNKQTVAIKPWCCHFLPHISDNLDLSSRNLKRTAPLVWNIWGVEMGFMLKLVQTQLSEWEKKSTQKKNPRSVSESIKLKIRWCNQQMV